MFSRVRIAIRFFFMGLAVGMLLAPRSGQETRRMLRERADRLLNDLLDAATLGTYESGAGGTGGAGAGTGGGDGEDTATDGRGRTARRSTTPAQA